MKRLFAIVALLSMLLLIVACAPAAAPQSSVPAEATPEAAGDVQELDDLGSLADEVDNDVSFEELDNVDLK
ncbi:hypothetical protein HYU22_03530 [Candidatus Woesearchaeota archaeon]|nr:hypothetical protein [Candidatus Woesearchaeota archaeon]